MKKLPDSCLYGVTDAELSGERSTIEIVEQMLACGVRIIQYREKKLSNGKMLEECLAIRELTRQAKACFIVNDHVDIGMVCQADGIHVGQDDMPLWAVRQLVGTNCLVGVSASNMEEAKIAINNGADYIGAGAVFPTGTKKDAVLTGLTFVQDLIKVCPVPVVAIGGINQENISLLAQAGVKYFALVSALLAVPSMTEAVRDLERSIAQSSVN